MEINIYLFFYMLLFVMVKWMGTTVANSCHGKKLQSLRYIEYYPLLDELFCEIFITKDNHTSLQCTILCHLNIEDCHMIRKTISASRGMICEILKCSKLVKRLSNIETQNLTAIKNAVPQVTMLPDAVTKVGSNVCFGAKDDAFGQFIFNAPNGEYKLKIVHSSGSVNCDNKYPNSNFGCEIVLDDIELVVTTSKDNVLITPEEFTATKGAGKDITEIETNAEFTFANENCYQIWYSQDREDGSEHNNGGTSCVDVYALYGDN